MNKQYLLIVALSLFSNFLFSQENANSILGQWHNEDSTQVVEFVKNGDVYNAKLVFIDKENAEYILDINNDDENLKHKKVLGSYVWTNFTYSADKEQWRDGSIYNYTNGNVYTGKIQIEGNELRLTGYYGFFFFLAKTQKWYSVKK